MDFITDRYTEQEYEKLQEILNASVYSGLKNAKSWLDSYDNFLQRDELTRILCRPIEDMPLLINNDNSMERILSRWRLKIGR